MGDIVEYMRVHSEEFAPFYVGDYDAYLAKMSKNGIWGGNMELTAAAKAFKVDIVIHSLNAARYEILYQKGKPLRSIHLSYHNERHYASVRRLDDMNNNAASKSIQFDQSQTEQMQREQQRAEIAWCHNGGKPLQIEAAKDTLSALSDIEQIVVSRTGCYDLIKVKKVLALCNGNIEAAVENIIISLNLMANESKEKIAKQLKQQKLDELTEQNKKKKKKKKKHRRKNKKKSENKIDKKEDDIFCVKVKVVENECNDDEKMDDINDWNKYYKERDERINAQKINMTKIECIDCCKKYNVLLLYLRHFKIVHLQNNKKKKEIQAQKLINCPCGFQNEAHFKFCSDCGWDLRLNIESDSKAKMAKKLLNTNGAAIVIHKKAKKSLTANADSKYISYLNKYWICDLCSFWNPNTSKQCMVCSMLNVNNLLKTKHEPQIKSSNVSWLDMYKNKELKATTKTSTIQKKKNVFAWICSQCTFENKPKNQKCAMCNNAKPKKGKKSKSLHCDPHFEDDDDFKKEAEDENDDKKWTLTGNAKCHCGSGKKYKKCCKKLQKHQAKNKKYANDIENDANDMKMINHLNHAIEFIEHQIDHFHGKKNDKIKMMKKLDKARSKRDALQKKLESDKNKAIKWK